MTSNRGGRAEPLPTPQCATHVQALQIHFIQYLDLDVVEPVEFGRAAVDEDLGPDNVAGLGWHVSREISALGEVGEIVVVLIGGLVVTQHPHHWQVVVIDRF